MATDTFTYSNGNLATVSAGVWADIDTGGGGGPLEVASGTVSGQSIGTSSAAGRYVGTFSDDQFAQCVIGGFGFFGADYKAGPIVRASTDTDANRDFYALVCEDTGPTTKTLRIFRVSNGTWTSLSNTTETISNGDTLRIEVEGTTLRGYLNGSIVSALTTTDSTHTSGQPGIVVSVSPITVDTWEGGDLAAGTAPTITDAGDEVYEDGETGIEITGTNFPTTAGAVIISPTDNAADGSAVEQTITARSAGTSVTFTAVRGSLPLDTNLYLFVENDSAETNAAGYVVQFEVLPLIIARRRQHFVRHRIIQH